MNLEPKIIQFDDGSIKIFLSADFRKIYDAEVDKVEYIMNCYYEDPNHCKIFDFNDIYQFNKELEDLKDTFMFKMLSSSLIKMIKFNIMYLCDKFVSGQMKAKSIDYYKMWDNQKFKN